MMGKITRARCEVLRIDCWQAGHRIHISQDWALRVISQVAHDIAAITIRLIGGRIDRHHISRFLSIDITKHVDRIYKDGTRCRIDLQRR